MSRDDHHMNIKYISIVNLESKTSFVEFMNKNYTDQSTKIHQTIESLIDKLMIINISANERHTENLRTERISCLVDSRVQWCYIIVTLNSYPERLSYQLLDAVKAKSIKPLSTQLIDISSLSTRQLRDDIQLTMVELEQKYKNPSNVDIIYTIQEDVSDVKGIMRKNIRNILTSQENANELNQQSISILQGSEQFHNNARELKKTSYWQNKKLVVIGGTLSAGVIGYLAYSFLL